ncbi:XRE family transcriptional regulator [Paraburkholderia tropica]|uniref:XRE family transcriptional regulator n=1 Tax=Paraburkholderia tropica TaxID=92647 RepID=UPI003D2BF5C3
MPPKYKPPSTQDLADLKVALSKSNPDMADLFGMSPDQWRKYTGGKEPRPVSLYMLFFAMARLELDAESIERVLERMRKVGAQIELSTTGEQEQ